MMIPRFFFTTLTLVASLLSGCAIFPAHYGPPNPVRDADESVAQRCRYLGQVTGRFVSGGSSSFDANSTAKEQARYKALQMGATDVHWRSGSSSISIEGGGETDFVGDAYRCGKT